MNIDKTDPIVQIIVNNDRPIAARKKRRRSIASPTKKTQGQDSRPIHNDFPPPQTPAQIKKRVRFSDPGPEVLSPSSTGITPFVKKTTIDQGEPSLPATPRWLDRPPRRRPSLPSLPRSRTDDSSSPIELQFEPLRQILTPRTKRQLGRNKLSEEMNQIDAEKKRVFKQEQEIEYLKDELDMERRRAGKDHRATTEQSTKIEELEEELRQLKSARASTSLASRARPMTSLEEDSVALVGMDVYEDPECVLVDATPEALPDSLTTGRLSCSRRVDQSNQTEGVEPSVSELEDHIKAQTAHLTSARLELERLHPGETALPLTPPANADCSPLLSAMLTHLRNAQSTLKSTTASLRASEAQESNVRAQFNGVLTNLDATREAHAQLLKGAKAGAEKYAQARERIAGLENELDESNRSSEKLKAALDSYRKEVKSMESLITRLENEGSAKLNALGAEKDAEKDEAVADLECWVAAETRGRREAEDELDTRALRIRTLESSQKELKEAIATKQTIVRGLEEELEQAKVSKEDEVGRLNVRVGSLEESLASARADIVKIETEKDSLRQAVIDGKKRELKTVASLKNELRKAVKNVEGVVGGWEHDASRKGEGVSFGGLMTPRVEGGRFRDVAMDTVEGTVEVKRGKSRKSRSIDSGIGLLEEDPASEE